MWPRAAIEEEMQPRHPHGLSRDYVEQRIQLRLVSRKSGDQMEEEKETNTNPTQASKQAL